MWLTELVPAIICSVPFFFSCVYLDFRAQFVPVANAGWTIVHRQKDKRINRAQNNSIRCYLKVKENYKLHSLGEKDKHFKIKRQILKMQSKVCFSEADFYNNARFIIMSDYYGLLQSNCEITPDFPCSVELGRAWVPILWLHFWTEPRQAGTSSWDLLGAGREDFPHMEDMDFISAYPGKKLHFHSVQILLK